MPTPPPQSDDRRVALVTGAGRGIGRAVAVRLAAEGYRVALTARSEDELRATAALLATESLVLPADMLDPAAPDTVTAAVEQAWGPVSVLVANAGAGSSAPVAKLSDELWASQLELNLTAPFRAVRRVVPAMVDHGWGRIVVVASMAAKRGEPYLGAYCAAKHGVLGLVRAAAAELAPTGVTANAVCPAYVDTAMTEGAVGAIVEVHRPQPGGRVALPRAEAADRAADHGRRGGRDGLVLRGQRRAERAGHQRRRRGRPGVSEPDLTLSYGPLPEHVVDVRLPAGDAGSGRRRWWSSCTAGSGGPSGTARTPAPQSAGLAAAGYVVATVEYRRVRMAGGGWPGDPGRRGAADRHRAGAGGRGAARPGRPSPHGARRSLGRRPPG